LIRLTNITLRRGSKVILDKANLTIHPGEKIGLVGRNGAGKSSAFSLLANRLQEDSGDLEWPTHWQWTEVEQNMPETSDSATQFVLGGDKVLAQAQATLEAAEATDDWMAQADAHVALADAGAHDAAARAQSLILGLGFQIDELDRPVNSFSGGWRMRLQLARALMCPADLMLLDEPTNHLDLDALVWLEAWLQRFAGTMIVISHDREFLDAVTKVTVHLENAQLKRYGGNYSSFEDQYAQQMILQQSAFAKQQDRVAHLQKFIDRFKAKASKAKQAQSRVKALERMERIAPIINSADFHFEFLDPGPVPNPMLTMRDAAFGYRVEGSADIQILSNVTRSVQAGERIGILGANGQGKSTLVKTLAGMQSELSGTMHFGKGLKIGYFAQQELDILRLDDGPLTHMVRLAKSLGIASREQDLRSFLGRFQFSDSMVHQAVGTLSGGERARLVLAMVVWQKPHLLLLDEPTNHLDLATREALNRALNEFEGTVMLVSHDRALLRAVCDEFWLVGHGEVKPFDGDLDDYQRYLLDLASEQRAERKAQAKVKSEPAPSIQSKIESAPNAASPASASPNAAAPANASASAKPKPSGNVKALQKKLAQLDAQMASLAQEQHEIETSLSQNAAVADMAVLGKRLKTITEQSQQLEEAWLELTEQMEACT
jgi:ATP-binding cassette, subfamily F, member 3